MSGKKMKKFDFIPFFIHKTPLFQFSKNPVFQLREIKFSGSTAEINYD
jgi:hypothetical protein